MLAASCLPPLRPQRIHHHRFDCEAVTFSCILHKAPLHEFHGDVYERVCERQAGAMVYPTLHSTTPNSCNAARQCSACDQQQPAQAISAAALVC